MYVTTKREVIRGVPDQWRAQYAGWPADSEKAAITLALDALDAETCSAEDVELIIGNSSWTSLTCTCCGASADVLIHIGDEPDYDAIYQDLCRACVIKAASMLMEVSPVGAE